MPIYLDGKEYEDETSLEAAYNPAIPPELTRIFVYPNMKEGENAPAPEAAPTMPLGSPEKPAGALESQLGTQVPPTETVYPEPSYINPPERDAPFPRPRMTEILSGLYDTAKNALSLTQAPPWALDQTTGEFHTSPEAISKAADLAGLMTFGPAPVAKGMADGTLGSFVGVKSKSIDKTKLYQAQNMALEGAHPDEIWKATGTFKGHDGHWRQEISDQHMLLKENAFDIERTAATADVDVPGQPKGWGYMGKEAVEKWKMKSRELDPNDIKTAKDVEDYFARFNEPEYTKLSDVVDHPQLFKAYPELKDWNVTALPQKLIDDGIKGQVSGNTIYLAPGNPEYLRSVLAHEIQHGIQRLEGFARGGNPKEFVTPQLEKAKAQFEKVREQTIKEIKSDSKISDMEIQAAIETAKFREVFPVGDPTREVWDDAVMRHKEAFAMKGKLDDFDRLLDIAKGERLLDNETLRQHELYKRLAGEVESRNVQTRLDFDGMERFLKTPRGTEDRPSFIQRQVGQTERIQLNNSPSSQMAEPPTTFRRAANDNDASKAISDKEYADGVKAHTASVKELFETENKLRDGRMELINKNAKGGWNEFDLAKFNKLGQEIADLWGDTYEPVKF